MHPELKRNPVALAIAAAIGASTLAAAAPVQAAKVAGTYVAGDFHNHNTCNDGSTSIQKVIRKATDKTSTPWNGVTPETPWGLDWFVQSGHGNSGGTRNCTLPEDASLATPLYPFVAINPPASNLPPAPYSSTDPAWASWADSIGGGSFGTNVKGDIVASNATTGYTDTSAAPSATRGAGYMWRWQSITEYEYPLLEYLDALKGLPLFVGLEENPWGHEHVSAAILTGQMPTSLDTISLPTTPGPAAATTDPTTGAVTYGRYTPSGNAELLAKHGYCFDRTQNDFSRGNISGTNTVNGTTVTIGSNPVGKNYDCTNPASPNSGAGTTISSGSPAVTAWNSRGLKLAPKSGTGSGTAGHAVTVEGVKWMSQYGAGLSYYVPAHLERAGPFAPDTNAGYNVESLRDFNNAAPQIAFGFETQPGHGASSERGEYFPQRNSIAGMSSTAIPGLTPSGTKVDSVGGTTYGGTGVYGSWVGGVWDAMLGEGRNYWFFASSDWHNRGIFGSDDRRSTQDFFPGEYQRNYTMVRTGGDKIRPQTVVDGLRSGNNWSASGQLIDRFAMVACASYPGIAAKSNAAVQAIAVAAATNNRDSDVAGCATMGEKLTVRPGADIVVSIVVRNPQSNFSPYSFANPSLKQAAVGITEPLNAPLLDHIDLIQGLVTGYKTPGAPDYAGQWPNNWLDSEVKWENGNAAFPTRASVLATAPAAAKNTSAAVIAFFKNPARAPQAALPVDPTIDVSTAMTPVTSSVDGSTFLAMTYRIKAVQASQYVRVRGSNLPPAVPFETDPDGNPLPDVYTNATITVTDAQATAGNPATVGSLRIPCNEAGTNVPSNAVTYTQANVASAPINGCPLHLPTVNGQKYVAYDVAAWSDLWTYSNPIYVQVNGSTVVAGL